MTRSKKDIVKIMQNSLRKTEKKSMILKLLIKHKYLALSSLHYLLKKELNISLAKRTVNLYVKQLLICGKVRSIISLRDSRTRIYYLAPHKKQEIIVYTNGEPMKKFEVEL